MKATLETNSQPTLENVVPLTVVPKPKPTRQKARFAILEFTNRSGTQSWRVSGYRRDGSRVRDNFASLEAAQCRQMDLEAEYLQRQTELMVRATRLTDDQLRLCETALAKLDSDDELLSAVDYWRKHGRANAVPESPLLDEAVPQFLTWLESSNLRETTRKSLRIRINLFCNSTRNVRVADIRPETIDDFLDGRKVSNVSKASDKNAVSSFFTWCMDRKRRWAVSNPCHAVKVERDEQAPPEVLILAECKRLLKVAQEFKDGCLLPYVSVCLFAGLRPTEAARLTWEAVNVEDREIRLESGDTKTKRGRLVAINDTLAAWLKVCQDRPFWPANASDDFKKLRRLAGFGTGLKPWPVDVMRHTSISHYFRNAGSYGQTAEQFGNSENIIKRHYQGRVTSEDTKRFYAIMPIKVLR
jgi:integrase